jgi:rRNA maturation endonuclease Nob1
VTSDREPGPSKQPAIRNTAGRHSKRKKEGEEEVVEQKGRFLKRKKEGGVVGQSEDELETIEGGDEQEMRENKGRTFAGDAVVESSDEDEVRVQVERLVNGKSKARTGGTGRTPTKQRKQASSRPSKKVLQIQGSDEEENEEVDIIDIDAPPIPPTKNTKASRVNGVGGKKGKKKTEGSAELDELLNGQDGVVALIDKIGTPDSVNVNTTTKDAEVARLKEKISRVSSSNIYLFVKLTRRVSWRKRIKLCQASSRKLSGFGILSQKHSCRDCKSNTRRKYGVRRSSTSHARSN